MAIDKFKQQELAEQKFREQNIEEFISILEQNRAKGMNNKDFLLSLIRDELITPKDVRNYLIFYEFYNRTENHNVPARIVVKDLVEKFNVSIRHVYNVINNLFQEFKI